MKYAPGHLDYLSDQIEMCGVHCLCTNLQLFQLVLLTNSSDKEGVFKLVCLRVWYLKALCMIY